MILIDASSYYIWGTPLKEQDKEKMDILSTLWFCLKKSRGHREEVLDDLTRVSVGGVGHLDTAQIYIVHD